MSEGRTKQGYVMDLRLRERVIQVMAESRGQLTLKAAAAELGINRRTLQDYLTQEVRAEVEARRRTGVHISLEDVDRAMMVQACAGNVAAARLVYLRMAQRGETGPLPSLAEMEAELKKLKLMESGHDGENPDRHAAVAAGAVGRAD